MPEDRTALGAFLRSRRDRLTPAQAGIPAFPGARRVPGLRREELAVLAGLSPDYYSRLEQGRQANVSDEVLGALGRALRLNDVEQAHLRDLAAPTAARRTPADVAQRPDPGLLRLMTALDHLPVLLLGHRGEVLARNALLRAVLGSVALASLRYDAGRRPHDRRLAALIDELRRTDPDVARWWDDHGVREYASVPKRIAHPSAGNLRFDIEIVSPPHEPDQRLVVYTAEPHSATAQVLPLLASWDTDTDTDTDVGGDVEAAVGAVEPGPPPLH